MRFSLAVLAVLALSACVPDDAAGPTPPSDQTCGAEGLQDLVGQSRRVLETMKFGVLVRVIDPGMAVTMDYAPGRLNIWIAEGGLIERVTCG
jgi:Peptidase inhibitor I78 family